MADSTKSPRLTILGGPLSGRELTLDEAVDNILIGSDSSCRFHLDTPGVSPIHARLWVDWQGVTVYDTGAPEGVYLNDDRVERSAPVRNGDILWLGPPGGADVVMIQCRVPARTGAPPPVSLPVVAPADAGATVVSAAAEDVPPEDVTETVAFAPPPEPAPTAAVEQETVWLTPDTVEDEAPAAPEPAFVSPFDTTDEDDGSAATVVLHTEPEPAALPEPVAADEDAAALAAVVDEPVKFEIDEPPQALTPAAAAFEEDIDEPAIDATVTMAAPAEFEPEPEPAVEPEPEPLPMAYTSEPAEPPPAPPAAVLPPSPAPPPAAPPTRPAPARVAPAPVVAPPTRPVTAPARKPAAGGSSAGKWVALAAVALVVIGAGVFALYRFVLSPAPAPTTTTAAATPPATLPPAAAATPTPLAGESTQPTEPAATPPIEEAVTIVKPQASPGAPTPTPRATPAATPTPRAGTPATPTAPAVDPRAQAAAQAAALASQGDAALAEQRHDAALAAYAQALQLDPQNQQAAAGRARAQAAQADARRTFVPGRSVLVGARSGKKGPAGFDDEDVAVAKAPDYSGRVEFEASPRSVKAGDTWTVRVFLVNDGKKEFRVQGVTATANVDGSKSPLPATIATREIATQKRALVAELSGAWREGTKSWSLEVAVTSAHGEVARNTLSWR